MKVNSYGVNADVYTLFEVHTRVYIPAASISYIAKRRIGSFYYFRNKQYYKFRLKEMFYEVAGE